MGMYIVCLLATKTCLDNWLEHVYTLHMHVHTMYIHGHTLYMDVQPALKNAMVQGSAILYRLGSYRDVPPKNG